MVTFDIIIPARLQSTRFPQKIFYKFYDLPMVEHVRRRALLIKGVSNVFVATCDNEVSDLINSNGGKILMTSPDCENGTERASEASSQLNSKYIILLQGDEPCFYPFQIEQLIEYVKQTKSLFYNLVVPISGKNTLYDTSSVKCSINNKKEITSCFRTSPYISKYSFQKTFVKKLLGIMCFERNFLSKLSDLERSKISVNESIEQLNLLENNISMKAFEVNKDVPSLNVKEDLKKIEIEFKSKDQQKILNTILNE